MPLRKWTLFLENPAAAGGTRKDNSSQGKLRANLLRVMSIKVYLHLELDGYPEKTSKLSIPKGWVTKGEKTVADVIELFLEGYNKVLVDTEGNGSLKGPLKADEVHLATTTDSSGVKVYSDAVIQGNLEDRTDYFVIIGSYVRPAVNSSTGGGGGGTGTAARADGMLKCKNFGCQKMFREEENHDQACHHHSMPPFFHDTAKGWQCCKDGKKAFDWDDFQKLPTCCLGRHSTEERQTIFKASPTVEAAATAISDAPPVKSIAAYNSANPTGVTAASAAVKLMERKSTRKEDGTAKCLRKGCQKIFKFDENSKDACCYHKGQPVFHDTYKYWSCCSEKKCFEFDAFMAVPGCAVGFHDDGVIDL